MRKIVSLPRVLAFTGDRLEAAVAGRIPVRVGLQNGSASSSQRHSMGAQRRKPTLLGSRGSIYNR